MKEYIAFDSHKHYTLMEREDRQTARTVQLRVAHQPGAIRTCLRNCESGTDVAVEATGNWYWIVSEIEQAGLKRQLVHPRKAKLMMGLINKTDKLDVHGLNRLQRNGTLPTVWIPPAELRDQRELTRTRLVLVAQRTRLKNRLQSTLAKYGLAVRDCSDAFGTVARSQWPELLAQLPEQTQWVSQQLLKQLDLLEEQIGQCEKRLTDLLKITPQIQRLKSLPGVGLILGASIAFEIGEVSRFASKTAHLSNLEGETGPENQSDARQALQALYLRGDFQQVGQAFLALADLFLQQVQLLEQLLTDPLRLFGQLRQQLRPLASGHRSEGIAAVPDRQSILGQGRLESVLQSSALSHQNQTRSRQFPLVAQLRRRNPHRGQGPVALKPVQAVDIQFVGLVDQAHHQLGFAGMHQLRFQSRLFNFADDPIPVAGGFNSDVGSALTVAQTSANRPRLMGDSELDRSCGLPVFSFH